MSQAIKLFGKTIPLQENQNLFCSYPKNRVCNKVNDREDEKKEPKEDEPIKSRNEEVTRYQNSLELKDAETLTDEPKTPTTNKEPKNPENDEQSETNESQEKILEKPHKIIPCPRCNSMDTKFCYYNNYNVNQPRYFCRNCQRYWTEGGNRRNVPVGSGRRKSKASFWPHYHHLMVSEADMANVLHQNNSRTNPNPIVLESLSFKKLENGNQVDPNLVRREGDLSTPQLPSFGAPPWLYHPWYPMPQPTNSTLGPSNLPVAFYTSPAYWGCPLPRNWNSAPCNMPPTLGKHSREGDMLKPLVSKIQGSAKNDNLQKQVRIPKTLRIDDPSETSRSLILSRLGIKHDENDSVKMGGHWKTLRSKCDEVNLGDEKSLVLQANPAAFSRSLNFHENV